MPRVDQLGATAAVADDDVLPVSQGGVLLQASRAQLVAGLQPALALAQGELLGRSSAGLGGPEAVRLGANISLAGGALSVAAPFSVAGCAAGGVPGAADLVAVGQGGRTLAVAYGQFMAGLGAVAGVDGSALLTRAAGGTAARRLGDVAGDAIAVEAFGAVGDGVSDDTAALAAAVASGRPVRLGAKTYVVNGQFSVSVAGTRLLGTAGASVLRRGSQVGNGAWISIEADDFSAEGVVFDANRAAVSVDSWGVLVTALCTRSRFVGCGFRNAAGSVLGSGLVVQASSPAVCDHVVRDCVFSGNAVHGLWVQACVGVMVQGCRAHGNGAYGLNLDFNDPGLVRRLRLVQVVGNRCWGNQRGIAVGNFNVPNTSPPVWGNADPDAALVIVAGNICHDNAVYGIAASGLGVLLEGNLLAGNGTAGNGGAGILANVSGSVVSGNMVTGASAYGIDCGGSVGSEISGNRVSGAVVGINCGGGTDLAVAGNRVQDCTQWAVCVNNVETDGRGLNFGLASNGTSIVGNRIGFGPGAGGVALRDGPSGVVVRGNTFFGAGSIDDCLWADTDGVVVEGNRFGNAARTICNPVLHGGRQLLRYPDIADVVMVTYAPGGVQAMQSSYQVISEGRISFVRVTAGGSGYGQAAVAIAGAGSGAAAVAMLRDGVVIGVVVTAPGSGYGPIGTAVAVTVSGDGSGATAAGFAGAPLAEERTLVVRCNCAVTFARAGAPVMENVTGTDLVVPANGDVAWRAAYGMWRAST